MVDQLRNVLVDAGVPGVRVGTGSPVINISWIHNPATEAHYPMTTSIGPLAVVAIIISAIAVIAVVVIGWRMYEDTPNIINSIFSNPWVIGLSATGIITLGAIAISRLKSGGGHND
jgi:hypothetical protein